MSSVIAKNVQIGADTTATNNFTVYQPATPNGTLLIGNGNTGITSSLVTLTSAGNVGIGTSSPAYKVHAVRSGGGIVGRFDTTSDGITDVYGYGLEITRSVAYIKGSSALHLGSAAGYSAVVLDSSGNLGLGVTPSVLDVGKSLQIGFSGNTLWGTSNNNFQMLAGATYNNAYLYAITGQAVSAYRQNAGEHIWYCAPSGTAGNAISFTQAMTLNASGNLLVGTTSAPSTWRLTVDGGSAEGIAGRTSASGSWPIVSQNTATSGNNGFVLFGTESSFTTRGSISYNRGAGLTTYNTTSDYRAKDISNPITDSGAVIDSVPVYMGKMKGATQERPMFIAHETPAYAHTGAKDAIDADGNPVYQQMDASALVPVMWAEIQSLRKRLAALEAA